MVGVTNELCEEDVYSEMRVGIISRGPFKLSRLSSGDLCGHGGRRI